MFSTVPDTFCTMKLFCQLIVRQHLTKTLYIVFLYLTSTSVDCICITVDPHAFRLIYWFIHFGLGFDLGWIIRKKKVDYFGTNTKQMSSCCLNFFSQSIESKE